jgi:NAD(P)-dependent dehydrogenase (short-subunit alcohol dehydrogenase family)
MSNVWFITGSSRGLGRSLTTAVLAHGDQVAATARHPEQLADLVAEYGDRILPLALDVTNNAQIDGAVAAAIAHFGHLDVVVNNAGYGIVGAAEAYTDEQVRGQLETNLYAPIAVTRAVLPHLRQRRSGHILQISSGGGRAGNPGVSIYQAAKFGLGGFSESLAKEVAPLDIRVTCVEPGGFRTDWAGASMSYAPEVPGYETTVGALEGMFQSGAYVPMGDPDKAAQVLLALVAHPKPPIHLLLGSDSVGLVQKAEADRSAELVEWLAVSRSTDHDAADNFLDTDLGKQFLKGK